MILANIFNLILLFFQPDTTKVDAIFIGGLENVISYSKQINAFEAGFGRDSKIILFKYKSKSSDVLEAVLDNPNVPVVMFSAGCNQAKTILLNEKCNPKRIYLIEPYSPNQKLTDVLIKTDFPPFNVFVGPNPERGSKLIRGSNPIGAKSHLESLRVGGIIIKREFRK